MTAAILHLDLDVLPPLSPLARELLRLDWTDNFADRELARIVRSEPQLAARLVGFANSVAFGVPGQPITRIEHCIARIGLRRTTQLAIAALFSHAISHRLPVRSAHALWLHALAVAFSAQEIGRLKGLAELDQAYFLGLVHDLGYMLIEYARAGSLDTLVETTLAENNAQEEAEVRLFGADHAELTIRVLQHWELPEELIDPIRRHHQPGIDPHGMAALVLGAEKIARAVDVVAALYADLGHPFAPLAMDRLGLESLFDRHLALTPDAVDHLVRTVIDEVDALRGLADAMHAFA